MKNYIKNFTRIFKRYCNPFLSSEKRFMEPDYRSSRWLQEYNNACMDKSEEGRRKLNQITRFTSCDTLANDVLTMLEYLTNDDYPDNMVFAMLNKLEKFYPFKINNIKVQGRDKLYIDLDNKKFISVARLSEFYPEFFVTNPEIVTKKRRQKCHYLAPKFATGAGDDFRVATGTVFRLSNKAKFLHSWVEGNVDNMDVVIDPTMNMVMNKDAYYRLFHIKKPLEVIESKDIKKEAKIVRTMTDNVDKNFVKLYLSSRKEALDLASKYLNIEESEK